MELDARKQKVLSAVVESYIKTGEPVGSKALAEFFGGTVSSATLRNEMAALAEMGYLEQPHTSAGRIPSHMGYRFYIDKLMNKKPLTKEEKQGIDDIFKDTEMTPDKILTDAGAALAELTNCAALSTTPIPNKTVTSHIEVVPVGRKSYLVLLITSAGVVKNKLCRLDFEVSQSDLLEFTAKINETLVRTPVEKITPAFIQTLAANAGSCALPLSPVIFTVYELARDISAGKLILEGQTNLLYHKELMNDAKELLSFLSKGSEVLRLLPPAQESKSISVRLGDELNRGELADASMIITSYNIGDNIGGTIGILGPARLDYAKVIPCLEYFAQSMGKLLTDTFDE